MRTNLTLWTLLLLVFAGVTLFVTSDPYLNYATGKGELSTRLSDYYASTSELKDITLTGLMLSALLIATLSLASFIIEKTRDRAAERDLVERKRARRRRFYARRRAKRRAGI